MKKLLLAIAVVALSLGSCKKSEQENPQPRQSNDTTVVIPPPPAPIDSTIVLTFTASGSGKLQYVTKQIVVNNHTVSTGTQNLFTTHCHIGDTVKFITAITWPSQYDSGDHVIVKLAQNGKTLIPSWSVPYWINTICPSGTGSMTISNTYIVN